MSINLQKGQRIDVSPVKLSVGLGWRPNVQSGQDFDLDASVFVMDKNKKVLSEEHFVFYNNLSSPCGGVVHLGDNLDGKSSIGDDQEVVEVDTSKLHNDVEEILFVVTIHEADKRKQNFGQVRDSYIRISNNEAGVELAKFKLDEDFSIDTAIEFGRLYKKDAKWKFDAMGIGYKRDLQQFLNIYV